MRRSARWCLSLSLACWMEAAPTRPAAAERAVLRVCSDPNNLPFSDRARVGFEDALARRLARALDVSLAYYDWPRRRGFLRHTLKADKCDVIMGVPAGAEQLATTRPYYRSSYQFVTRGDTAPVRSLDDPRLRSLRVGVPLLGDDYANPPPVHALSRRHIVDNVIGYSVFGDYREDSPPLGLLRALTRREIDVAIAWGPQAGFYAKRHDSSLRLAPVRPRREDADQFEFEVALGVRTDREPLRRALDAVLVRERTQIQELLREYGVPQS